MRNGKIVKKTLIFTLIAAQVAIPLFSDVSYGWSYPLKQVTKLECKRTPWEELKDECKQDLPRITNAQYAKHATNTQYTYIYSTLWGATYNNWRDFWAGSHEWVDIASAQGTPVYAIGNWVVTKAWRQNGYGNAVVIKHTLPDNTVLYSTYAHLNSVNTQEGWKVNEGDFIGTVGNVWFSFGNHLLWNINRTKDNTYAYRGCPDFQSSSVFSTYETIVNSGLCRDYLFKRTLDPIAFVETNGNITATEALMKRWTTPATTNTTVATTQSTKRVMVPLLPTPPVATTSTKTPTTTKSTTATKSASSTTTIKTTTSPATKPATTTVTKPDTTTVTKPATTTTSKPTTVATKPTTTTTTATPSANIPATKIVYSTGVKNKDAFLQKYIITVTPAFETSMAKWSSSSLSVKITDLTGKPFAGMIGKELSIMPSIQNIDISPRIVRYISQGETILLLYAKEKWNTDLVVMYGDIVLGKIALRIQ